jgi:hypothetical protein
MHHAAGIDAYNPIRDGLERHFPREVAQIARGIATVDKKLLPRLFASDREPPVVVSARDEFQLRWNELADVDRWRGFRAEHYCAAKRHKNWCAATRAFLRLDHRQTPRQVCVASRR